jgi:hypothetical protein
VREPVARLHSAWKYFALTDNIEGTPGLAAKIVAAGGLAAAHRAGAEGTNRFFELAPYLAHVNCNFAKVMSVCEGAGGRVRVRARGRVRGSERPCESERQ